MALKSDWEWFLDAPERYADVLGEGGLATYRERLDREWEKLPAVQPDPERRFHPREPERFRVSHLKESLARAAGSVASSSPSSPTISLLPTSSIASRPSSRRPAASARRSPGSSVA